MQLPKFNIQLNISAKDLVNGNFIISDWVRKQYRMFFLIIGGMLLIIFSGYKSQRQQSYLTRLENEIQDANYIYLTEQARLSEMTRRSIISQKLRESGSQVHESTIPATRIE